MFKNSFPGLGKQQFKPKCQRFECSDTGFTCKLLEISRQCSSAVERARSMLQRSRNTGLCSRLNQRERLRASSPSPSLGNNRGKKPKEPEQSKPFEFALAWEPSGLRNGKFGHLKWPNFDPYPLEENRSCWQSTQSDSPLASSKRVLIVSHTSALDEAHSWTLVCSLVKRMLTISHTSTFHGACEISTSEHKNRFASFFLLAVQLFDSSPPLLQTCRTEPNN